MNEQNNERGQNMSSSALERNDKCKASFLRSRWIPSTTSEAAERGLRIHDALDGGDPYALEHNEAVTAERCLEIAFQVMESLEIPANEVPDEDESERRVQTLICEGKYKFSGQWDLFRLYLEHKAAFVFDWKTGPRGATAAENNIQLASLAALSRQCYNIPDDVVIYVVLVTPLKSPQYTLASYRADALGDVLAVIDNIAEAAHDPNSPATAGEHCRYCPARVLCPEYKEATVSLQPLADSSALMINPAEFAARLNLGDLCVTAHKEDRELARQLLSDGRIEIPGWKIQERKGRDKILPEPLLQKMGDEGYLAAMLGTMVSVTKKGLQAVVKTKTGLAGKALNSEVDRLLEGCKEPGKPSKSLVKA